MKRLVCGAIALSLIPSAQLHAQSPSIDDLKGKIFDAGMAKQMFANGLKFCGELDGKNFTGGIRSAPVEGLRVCK